MKVNGEVHPVDPEKRAAVLAVLESIEQRHDVRIVFACESGSRSWGFASPDSDYDARFVYVHARNWYLTVNEHTGLRQSQRDVIELPIDAELDVSGWDLRKTLRLLSKANPTLLEWMRSPIVYWQDAAIANGLRTLADAFYSPMASWHHYRSMAKGNYRGYLQGGRIRTKKYLYVLRPLLACQWIEQAPDGDPPPMEFERLLDVLLPEGTVRDAIEALLILKRRSREIEEGPRIAQVSDYIIEQMQRMEHIAPVLPKGQGREEQLDDFFRSVLRD